MGENASPSKFYEALNAAGFDYSALSTNGINLFGDRASIKAAELAFHRSGQWDDLCRNLRHWQEECGKLHARIKKLEDEALAKSAPASFMGAV
jgi:hypothetical protein